MNRRDFLRNSAVLGATLGAASILPMTSVADTGDNSKFLFTLYAHGGWDPTSFCDPKMNIKGEPIMNNWGKTGETQTAGNIEYAPFADNERFFNKHYRKMLVINGVNVTTGSHQAGERFNKTGVMDFGYPSLAALYASIKYNNHLMPWITDGWRPTSGGLVAQTNVNGNYLKAFKTLTEPNNWQYGNSAHYVESDNLNLIRDFRNKRVLERASNSSEMMKQRSQYRRFIGAMAQGDGLPQFTELVASADYNGLNSGDSHYTKVVAALAGFASGVCVAADIKTDNMDTHNNHDIRGAEVLTRLTNQVDLLWHVAEQFGIADRLLVNIVSDIGRTPGYNEKNGKDHWSTTSTIVMENNPSWGNRVVGSSTHNHRAQDIDFVSMKPTGSASDITLSPNHIQSALRRYIGIDNHATSKQFSLADSHLIPNLF